MFNDGGSAIQPTTPSPNPTEFSDSDSVRKPIPAFCCPVCRAKQELSNICRRCTADLTLAVKIRQRLAYLLTLPLTSGVRAEIASLSPNLVRSGTAQAVRSEGGTSRVIRPEAERRE